MNYKKINRWPGAFLCMCCILCSVARAQDKLQDQASIKVEGEVTTPLKLYAADLAKMPRTTVSSKDKSGTSHNYTGRTGHRDPE